MLVIFAYIEIILIVINLEKFNNDQKMLPNYMKKQAKPESESNFNPKSNVRSRFKQLSRMNKHQFKSQESYDNDEYLSDLLNVLRIKSLVVGVGGAGNNTVSRLQDVGISDTDTLNINTDAHDLYYSNSSKKILIGKETCNGLGSGNDPTMGQEAAEEDSKRISKSLNADIVFLTCGLGGGTGTGAAPIVAREAKKNGSMVVSFCSLPFDSEGTERKYRAMRGLRDLATYSDSIIPIPNNNLLQIVPDAPILTCFKIMDEVLVRFIKEVTDLINNCGLVNIDFADVKKVFQKQGKYPTGLIGLTESFGETSDLINKSRLAVHNPLLKPNIEEVDKCLVSVSSDHHLTLSNIDNIISTISHEIPEEAQLKFGTSMDPTLGSKIKIMALGRGPVSPYVKDAFNI
jgi:cell division protein FtsZ